MFFINYACLHCVLYKKGYTRNYLTQWILLLSNISKIQVFFFRRKSFFGHSSVSWRSFFFSLMAPKIALAQVQLSILLTFPFPVTYQNPDYLATFSLVLKKETCAIFELHIHHSPIPIYSSIYFPGMPLVPCIKSQYILSPPRLPDFYTLLPST